MPTLTWQSFFVICFLLVARPVFSDRKVTGMTFLVSVNRTFSTEGCVSTGKTQMLIPDTPRNVSTEFLIGRCDKGTLTFHVTPRTRTDDVMVHLTFYSGSIPHDPPPTCSIPFPEYSYKIPTTTNISESLLPGCFTTATRYYLTYYWFRILDWTFA